MLAPWQSGKSLLHQPPVPSLSEDFLFSPSPILPGGIGVWFLSDVEAGQPPRPCSALFTVVA